MTNTLLTTKFFVPRTGAELVLRPRLIDQMNAGLQGKLIVVSAPAGYGKTTMVSDWITQVKLPVAWLSLNRSDSDLSLFFRYFIAALQVIHHDIGTDIQAVLQADVHPLIEHLLTPLVNDLAVLETNFILVLDDYHSITEFKIHEALDFLFDHLPPGMHLVIISRADLPMPLGRLRVQRQLAELREIDLRFTKDEIAIFFNDLMGLDLTNEDIQKLARRTEGWIGGLQLAALSLHGRSDKQSRIAAFSGSHGHMIEYLADEVMLRQPEKVQAFLLNTAVLEQFNAPLCDAVTQDENSSEMLHALEKANLFLVPLDNEGEWYRYHHLFADFLRKQVSVESTEISELFIRASQWFESQGMMQEAFDHALNGGDAIQAARLLDKIAQQTIFNAGVRKMIRWANKLPVDVRARFPRLCIYHAWALVLEFQLESAETALMMAESHLEDPKNLPKSFSAVQITHHATAIRVYLAWASGEYDRCVDLSHEAIASLSRDKPPDLRGLQGAIKLCLGMTYIKLGQIEAAYQALHSALLPNLQTGNRYSALSCLLYLMEVEMARGKLDQAARHAEMGFSWIEEWSGSGPKDQMERPLRMLAGLRRLMGRVQYERNDLENSAKNIRMVYDYYELVQYRLRPIISLALVDLHQAMGDKEKALAYLGKVKRVMLSPGLSVPDFAVAAAITERNLLLNRFRPELNNLLAEAADWAEDSNLAPGDEFPCDGEYEYCTLARVLIASDKAKEAIPLLERLIKYADDDGRNGNLITYLSLLAVAHRAHSKIESALRYLSQALKLGESGGYVRTFVDLGEPRRDRRQATARQKMAPAYVSGLLAAFPDREPTFSSQPAAIPKLETEEVLVDPLNEREVQILRLLSARRSYQEISEELYLSLNTIKWYTRNIYSKLGVNKKNQAAARAQELGIL